MKAMNTCKSFSVMDDPGSELLVVSQARTIPAFTGVDTGAPTIIDNDDAPPFADRHKTMNT